MTKSQATVMAKLPGSASVQSCLMAAVVEALKLRSILDNDLYKFSMGNAVNLKYPDVRVKYRFTDRAAKGKWNQNAVRVLKKLIQEMRHLALTPGERAECQKRFPWIHRIYWDHLAAYRYDPSEVTVWLDKDKNLQIEIAGLWSRTIYWEVPLLALVSEVYFTMIDTDWTEDGQVELMETKAKKLFAAGVLYADFGTRRRRNFAAQERAVVIAKKYSNFTGTSNVHLAIKHGVKATGTQAHEWPMAHAALFSLQHADRYSLHAWNDVYQGNLGTALPDAFGSKAFLRDFNGVLARLFDSVRQDSGDPYEWAPMLIEHYTSLGIDWKTKPFGFTDGNSVDSAIAIKVWMTDRGGKCWFGIGTHLTNDYGPASPACNIVIKLTEVEVAGRSIPVVKLSDTPSKATGDDNAIRVAMWTHYGVSLDDPSHALRKAPYHPPVPANCNSCAMPRRKKAA